MQRLKFKIPLFRENKYLFTFKIGVIYKPVQVIVASVGQNFSDHFLPPAFDIRYDTGILFEESEDEWVYKLVQWVDWSHVGIQLLK